MALTQFFTACTAIGRTFNTGQPMLRIHMAGGAAANHHDVGKAAHGENFVSETEQAMATTSSRPSQAARGVGGLHQWHLSESSDWIS